MTNPLKDFMDLLPGLEKLHPDGYFNPPSISMGTLKTIIAAIHYLQSGVAAVPASPIPVDRRAVLEMPEWDNLSSQMQQETFNVFVMWERRGMQSAKKTYNELRAAISLAASPSPAAKMGDET